MTTAPAAAPGAAGRRVFLVVALLVAGAALGFVSFGNIGENLVYYWDVGQLHDAGDKAVGATIRLGGVVKEDSVDWKPEDSHLAFVVTDGEREVPVECTGAPPQMFREGIGVIVEGQLRDDGVFECDTLLVKHDNQYQAPEDGSKPDMQALKESLTGDI